MLYFIAGAMPTFNQFANVPPPSSIANLPGLGLDSVFEPRLAASQQFAQEPQVYTEIRIEICNFMFEFTKMYTYFFSSSNKRNSFRNLTHRRVRILRTRRMYHHCKRIPRIRKCNSK